MKKTNSMRVAVAMLALTMITSCFVGGTFAKYVTSANGGDSARVAKFGVQIEAGESAFLDKYTTDEKDGYQGKYSVASPDGTKVVAPGTSGEIQLFSISGTPEVAVRIDAVMDNVESIMIRPIIGFTKVTVEEWEVENWEINVGTGESTKIETNETREPVDASDLSVLPEGKTWTELVGDPNDSWVPEVEHKFTESYEYRHDDAAYYPIKWTLKKNGADVAYGTLADVKNYIGEHINGKEFAPNTNLADEIGGEYTLKWEWVFENNEPEGSMAAYDKYDTTLGDIAAGEYGIYLNKDDNEKLENKEYNLTEAFDFTITVTQID